MQLENLTCLLPLALLAAPTAAQSWTLQPLVLEGDSVPGVGLVTSIQNFAINDNLDWRVEADTDNPSTDDDYVLLGPFGLVLQENQPLPLPVGAVLDSFDALTLNASGNSAVNYFLKGTTGTSDDSGIYYNTNLLIQESQISGALAFTPGTPYIGFFETKLNDNDDILVMASVDDPAIATSVDRALVKLTIDASGGLASETVLFKEGDTLPGTTGLITDFGTGPHNFDMNNAGSVMYFADTNLATTDDGFIYIDSIQLAAENGPSPVVGRLWSSLSSPELSLNNNGEFVYSGSLQGDSTTNLLIVKNNTNFRQEGDAVPSLPAFKFTSFGSGPIDLADTGDVLWYGDWDDSATDFDTGLFVNDELIVQEGVSTVGGVIVDTLSGVQEGYFLSNDGRFVIFEATLLDGTTGAFLATRSGGITAVTPGCAPSGATLMATGGAPTLGGSLQLTFDGPQSTPAITYLGLSSGSWVDGSGCGLPVAGIGEILIDILPPNPILIPAGVHSGAPVVLPAAVPTSINLIGATFYLQGMFIDPVNLVEPIRMTNGLTVFIGL